MTGCYVEFIEVLMGAGQKLAAAANFADSFAYFVMVNNVGSHCEIVSRHCLFSGRELVRFMNFTSIVFESTRFAVVSSRDLSLH